MLIAALLQQGFIKTRFIPRKSEISDRIFTIGLQIPQLVSYYSIFKNHLKPPQFKFS